MKKKILVFGVVIAIALITSALSLLDNAEPKTTESHPESNNVVSQTSQPESETNSIKADVVMPTKVSRPGCEKIDGCFVPSQITIHKGESVTWVNEDAAFHSVTSGYYNTPSGLFDSGYLDPYQSFSYTFEETGTYHYYCTLHPWMEGQIMVE